MVPPFYTYRPTVDELHTQLVKTLASECSLFNRVGVYVGNGAYSKVTVGYSTRNGYFVHMSGTSDNGCLFGRTFRYRDETSTIEAAISVATIMDTAIPH